MFTVALRKLVHATTSYKTSNPGTTRGSNKLGLLRSRDSLAKFISSGAQIMSFLSLKNPSTREEKEIWLLSTATPQLSPVLRIHFRPGPDPTI